MQLLHGVFLSWASIQHQWTLTVSSRLRNRLYLLCMCSQTGRRARTGSAINTFIGKESSMRLIQTWGFSDCSQGILDMGHSDCPISSYMLQAAGSDTTTTCTQRQLGGWLWPQGSCAVQSNHKYQHKVNAHAPQWLLATENLTAPPFPAAHSSIPACSSAIWAPQWSKWLRNTNRNSCSASVGRKGPLCNCSGHWA